MTTKDHSATIGQLPGEANARRGESGSMTAYTKSTDFHIGQPVICKDPDEFISEYKRYLSGRTGAVEKIYPAERPDPNYSGHINKVFVRWQKKSGRGKERAMVMSPTDLQPIEEQAND